MSKKLVYVSGKYGGNEENKKLFEDTIIASLTYDAVSSNENNTYISPVHTFGFLYDCTDYLDGIDMCLDLLNKCDEILMLPNWKESTGACIEYGFAMANNIPITFL